MPVTTYDYLAGLDDPTPDELDAIEVPDWVLTWDEFDADPDELI